MTKKFYIKTQQTLLSSLLDVLLQTDRSKIKNIANVTVKNVKHSMVPSKKMKLFQTAECLIPKQIININELKNIINPYNCLLKNASTLIKTSY